MNVPLIVRSWGAVNATLIRKEHAMEQRQVLSINSHARIEHVRVEAPTLNKAFTVFEDHLERCRLPRPQILASAFEDDGARIMLTGESEALESLMKSLNSHSSIKAIKSSLSAISVTCRGSVATELAHANHGTAGKRSSRGR